MLDKIYVFDDIIDLDYQNKIKNELLGKEKYQGKSKLLNVPSPINNSFILA